MPKGLYPQITAAKLVPYLDGLPACFKRTVLLLADDVDPNVLRRPSVAKAVRDGWFDRGEGGDLTLTETGAFAVELLRKEARNV